MRRLRSQFDSGQAHKIGGGNAWRVRIAANCTGFENPRGNPTQVQILYPPLTSIKNMNTKVNPQISVGGAILFRDYRGKRQYFVVQGKDGKGWEIAKVMVRKGESSVRGAIRMVSEQGGMSARVLEEAGRYNTTAIVNGKSIPQKFYYYLMLQKGGPSEMIGFEVFKWAEYGDALKKLNSKKEKEMLKDGHDVLKEWEKTHKVENH